MHYQFVCFQFSNMAALTHCFPLFDIDFDCVPIGWNTLGSGSYAYFCPGFTTQGTPAAGDVMQVVDMDLQFHREVTANVSLIAPVIRVTVNVFASNDVAATTNADYFTTWSDQNYDLAAQTDEQYWQNGYRFVRSFHAEIKAEGVNSPLTEPVATAAFQSTVSFNHRMKGRIFPATVLANCRRVAFVVTVDRYCTGTTALLCDIGFNGWYRPG